MYEEFDHDRDGDLDVEECERLILKLYDYCEAKLRTGLEKLPPSTSLRPSNSRYGADCLILGEIERVKIEQRVDWAVKGMNSVREPETLHAVASETLDALDKDQDMRVVSNVLGYPMLS